MSTPIDKTILQLPNQAPLLTDTGVFSDTGGTFGFTFTQLLALIQLNINAGAIVTFGTTIPANTVGNNGDIYVKTDTQQFAQKQSGIWTVVYTVAAGVADGTVLFGVGVPSGTVGKNGDTYIATDTGVFYQRPSGTWGQVFSMATGPAGPRGNSILNGSGSPGSGTGTNGDFYIDTVANILYGPKVSGVWPGSGLSLVPLIPNTVLSGTANPLNSQGNNGDFYINTATYYIFGPKASGVWPTGVSIIGPNGVSGNIEVPLGQAGAISSFTINWQTDIPPGQTSTYVSLFGNILPKFTYYDGTDGSSGYTPNQPQLTVVRVSGVLQTVTLLFGVPAQGAIVF